MEVTSTSTRVALFMRKSSHSIILEVEVTLFRLIWLTGYLSTLHKTLKCMCHSLTCGKHFQQNSNTRRKGIAGNYQQGGLVFLSTNILARETLIFTRIHDNIVVGLRRCTPYNVPREMVERATLSYFVKEDFTVDYYPQAGDPFVTLIGGEDEEYEGEDEEDDEE